MKLRTCPHSFVYALCSTSHISVITTCGSNILIPFLLTATFIVNESSVSRSVEARFIFQQSSCLLTTALFTFHKPRTAVAVSVNEQKLFLECLEFLNVLIAT